MADFGEKCFVTLTTVDDQVYKGTLVDNDERTGKLRLKNVTINKTKLPGLQNFFVTNIKDLELTKMPDSNKTDIVSDTHQGKNKATTQQSHKNSSSKHKDGCVSGKPLGSSFNPFGDQESVDQGIGSSSEENENFDDYYEMENYTLFCRTCDKFRDSIRYLMSQDFIAVTFFGMDVSRNGVLSLIQVATDDEIILYDILRLGMEGFVDGLQAVFESHDIIKVVHDCRMPSDALFHQFDVALSNVFDTQVGGVFAYRLCNGGDWPRFVDSLSMTLINQLGLRNDEVHHYFDRDRSNQSDDIWLQRPLCPQLIQNSLKNLVNMIPLYHTLRAKLMMEFEIGVQLYLDHVRDMPRERIDKSMSLSHLLPYVFQDLPRHAADAAKEKRVWRAKSCLSPKDFTGKDNSSAMHGGRDGRRTSVKDKDANSASGYDCKISTTTNNDSSERQTWSVKQKSKRCGPPSSDHGLTKPSAVPTPSELSHRLQSEVSSHLQSPNIASCTPDSTSSKNYHGLTEHSSAPSPAELSRRLQRSEVSSPLQSPNIASCTPDSASISNHRPTEPSATPSPSELIRRLQSTKVSEPTTRMSTVSSGSEGYVSSRSVLARSALNQLASPPRSSTSSIYSESPSEPEIEDVRKVHRRGSWNEKDWDADKVMEMEMTQSILRQARQGQGRSNKLDIQKRLLPSKIKVSPKPANG